MWCVKLAVVLCVLGLSGCFTEVQLPICSGDSECVNAGFCSCQDGYCFRCVDAGGASTCDSKGHDICDALQDTNP